MFDIRTNLIKSALIFQSNLQQEMNTMQPGVRTMAGVSNFLFPCSNHVTLMYNNYCCRTLAPVIGGAGTKQEVHVTIKQFEIIF